ncbi:MAG: hypothetical protein ACRCZS_23070, partial [Chroococcidiopsis sp.]
MTDALAKSLGYQLESLEQYIQANYNWESPESGFARYVFYHAGSKPLFNVATDTVIHSLEPRRLHQAPILATIGYELACGRSFGESLLTAWANGLTRLSSREAFPSDRASFFYRPVELLGISLGASFCPKVCPKNLHWLQNVLVEGEQKLVKNEFWTFLLSSYAAQILSVSWKFNNPTLLLEAPIDELALVKCISSFYSSFAKIISFNQLESEIDKLLLECCITIPLLPHDISRAAVLYLALKKTVTLTIQAHWEHYWQFDRNTKEAINLIKSLCDRFHFVAQQLQSQNYQFEATNESDIQDFLRVLSQLRRDAEALEARAIEAVRQKLSIQTINQGIMITGGNFTMNSNQNNSIEVQQNFHASVYGVAGKVEGDQNIFLSEQKQTLSEAAQEIQQ